MLRLDSTGQSSASLLDESFSSGCEDGLEDVGCCVSVDIVDERISPCDSRTVLSVSTLESKSDNFSIRLATNHHSFSLGRSVTIRTLNSLYFLQVNNEDDIF